LFEQLPSALGLPPIPSKGKPDKQTVQDYANALATALHEIADIDQRLRSQVLAAMAEAFRLPASLPALRADLARQTNHLRDATLIEPRLRGLITVTHDTATDDDQWLSIAVVNIAGRGMNDWSDSDAVAFARQAEAIARTLDRMGHLYQTSQLENGSEAYSRHVLTLTGADGREEHAVVHVPDAARDAAYSIAKQAIAQARQTLGAQGERVLLAMLAQALISGADADSSAPAEADALDGKAAS
jgi:hypothetical protein